MTYRRLRIGITAMAVGSLGCAIAYAAGAASAERRMNAPNAAAIRGKAGSYMSIASGPRAASGPR